MKLILQECNFYLVVDERIGIEYMFDEIFSINIIVRQLIFEEIQKSIA